MLTWASGNCHICHFTDFEQITNITSQNKTNQIFGNFHLKNFSRILWCYSLILANGYFENILLVQTEKNIREPHYLLKLNQNFTDSGGQYNIISSTTEEC